MASMQSLTWITRAKTRRSLSSALSVDGRAPPMTRPFSFPSRYSCAARAAFAIYSLWASMALVWGWLAAVVIIGLPLYENKETIANVLHWKTAEAANVTMTRTDPGAGSETSKV